ncbi:hypothetical protein BDK51DRAFT_48421 [Blyttiomyces helicus]|uniref:Uncharacterized protein n=1 Tax=Blyttiomyces helicus TaxID=388810 RepID=A0A4P9W8S6_9FUNG|nr:hypothetical protein BDK51DRAFT_48421 [Blyttiomyces helicus]|eukprot:RKO87875.1 hypothetical protein BDK51DRAFT_48421 [Blyttiomyces helicus]
MPMSRHNGTIKAGHSATARRDHPPPPFRIGANPAVAVAQSPSTDEPQSDRPAEKPFAGFQREHFFALIDDWASCQRPAIAPGTSKRLSPGIVGQNGSIMRSRAKDGLIRAGRGRRDEEADEQGSMKVARGCGARWTRSSGNEEMSGYGGVGPTPIGGAGAGSLGKDESGNEETLKYSGHDTSGHFLFVDDSLDGWGEEEKERQGEGITRFQNIT